jgi:hypothetical protein
LKKFPEIFPLSQSFELMKLKRPPVLPFFNEATAEAIKRVCFLDSGGEVDFDGDKVGLDGKLLSSLE